MNDSVKRKETIMALSKNVKGMILSIARDNDIQKAKKYCQAIVANETAEKNKDFCRQVLSLLNSASLNI